MTASKDQISEWVYQYTDDLVNWAYFKTKDRALAEDLIQETFISAHKNIDKFQNKSQPKTWLFSILRNKIADHYRNKMQKYTMRESDFFQAEDNTILDRIFNDSKQWNDTSKPQTWNNNEEELLDNEEFNHVLKKCLEGLNEKSFMAVQLKYLEEKKGKDICQELNITPSNFWQLLHRAKLQVRECIETNWFIN